MFTIVRAHLVLLLALAFAVPAFANTDPTLHQVYEAARGGQLEQAQQMMKQVLRDHPKSAKAHYVAAELYARQGDTTSARRELDVAQQLEPGLSFAKPESVRALQTQIAHVPGYASAGESSHSSFPWAAVLLVVAGIGVLALVIRGRSSAGAAPPIYAGSGPNAAGPMGNSLGTGIGSGIAGGLASGLAVGAGVVAGEEIARHFLDRRDDNAPLMGNAPIDAPSSDKQENFDMGGSDFGVSNDDSWDDVGSVGGDISGDDWS
jgi:hypothetical protein